MDGVFISVDKYIRLLKIYHWMNNSNIALKKWPGMVE